MHIAAQTAPDTSASGGAWSFVCLVRRTSENLPAAAWLCAAAADVQTPARPAPPAHPETMVRENPSVTRLPQREISAQGSIERLTRNQYLIIHPRTLCARTKLLDMGIDLRAISSFRIFGDYLNSPVRFEVDKERRSPQLRANLLRIENVKQHHLVAMKPQRCTRAYDLFRLFVKIRDQDDDSAPV